MKRALPLVIGHGSWSIPWTPTARWGWNPWALLDLVPVRWQRTLVLMLHLAFGVSGMFTRKPFTLVFYAVALTMLLVLPLLDRSRRSLWWIVGIAWLSAMEGQTRALNCEPWIPRDIGKWLWLVGPLFLLPFIGRRIYIPGLAMLALLLPAAFYDLSGSSDYDWVEFNLLAPLATGMGLAVLGRQPVDLHKLHMALRMGWLALVTLLVYLLSVLPPLQEVPFVLGSNFVTSAFISPNSATTLMGLGLFLSLYAIHGNLRFSGYRWLDAIVAMCFAFQAMVTFSRGGVVVALLCLFLYLLFDAHRQWKIGLDELKASMRKAFWLALVLLILFLYLDHRTSGKLFLRWAGNTERSMRGEEEKGITTYTTGRDSIISQDIQLWMEHPVAGVGAGASTYLRSPQGKSNYPHTEFTRLLSEHGLPGLMVIILFLYILYRFYRSDRDGPLRDIQLVLFLFGLLSTFHSATRTFISPLLLSLGAWGVGVRKEGDGNEAPG